MCSYARGHGFERNGSRHRRRTAALVPPGGLRGQVDEPTPGTRVARTGFTVRGWSTWDGRPAVAVVVRANGVTVGRPLVGSRGRTRCRRGNRSRRPGRCRLAGWTRTCVRSKPRTQSSSRWRSGLTRPSHPSNSPGSPSSPTMSHRFRSRPAPQGSRAVTSSVRWALRSRMSRSRRCSWSRDGRCTVRTRSRRSMYSSTGRWVQRARLGIARPDVRDHYDLPDAIISGFECWVDLERSPHRHRI